MNQPPLLPHPRRRPLADRFWEKVDTSGGPDACWPWTAGRTTRSHGPSVYYYGLIRAGDGERRILLAHRVALMLDTGEMPEDRDACHTCDNTLCCNPAHLFWGSHRENMLDYIRKYGRLGVEKRPPLPKPLLPFEDDDPTIPF